MIVIVAQSPKFAKPMLVVCSACCHICCHPVILSHSIPVTAHA